MIISVLVRNKIKKNYTIDSNSVRIGRGSDNSITLRDKKISRNHILIFRDKNNLRIKDLNSTNGSYINNIKIKPDRFYDIKTEDNIRIGSSIIRISPEKHTQRTKNKLIIPLAISLSTVVIIAIILISIFANNDRKPAETIIESPTETIEAIDEPEIEDEDIVLEDNTAKNVDEIPSDVSSIIENILPSVVEIGVVTKNGEEYGGSGVIYNDNGYIITNYHVIENSETIYVRTYDGNIISAKLIGSKKNFDLALLKIESQNLKVPIFGTSNNLKIGQDVVAIGSPYGLTGTATKGIVSSLKREVKFDFINILNAIQHDADINPGNSGGPLIDLDGKVVGINFSIISPDYSSSGLSFAIPIDLVLREF